MAIANPKRLSPDERRAHSRGEVERLCKLQRVSEARFLSAFTHNVSEGGAMVEVLTRDPIREGETLTLGVSWDHRPVIAHDKMVRAVVVRADPMGVSTQRLAVRFAGPQPEAKRLVEVLAPERPRSAA